MKIKPLFLLWIFAFLLPATVHSAKKEKQVLPALEQQNFDYYYYAAINSLNTGKLDNGMAYLLHCERLAPKNAAVHALLSSIYAATDSVNQAVAHAKAASENEPENWIYTNDYIALLAEVKSFDEAEKAVKRYIKTDPWNEEAWEIYALLLAQRGQYRKAIQSYNKVETLKGINETASIEKFKLYMACGKEKQALNEIDKLVNEYPTDYRYQVLRGQLYMGQGMPEKAFETYQTVLQKNPENPYVYLSLADYYNKKNEPEKAIEQIMTALNSKELDVNTKIQVYGQYINNISDLDKKKEELEHMLKSLVEQYPFEENVHLYYAMYLTRENRLSEAEEEWYTLLEINPKNANAWYELNKLYIHQENVEKMIALNRKAVEALPEDPFFRYQLGSALAIQKDYETAIDTFQNTLALCNEQQAPLKGTIYMYMGDLYLTLGEKEQSLASYEQALQYLPNDAGLLNNYAYTLATTGGDLKKAERMSQATINKDPENPIYLDTYAWILYLQGYYSLSKIYIEQALKYTEKDDIPSEYWEHYGYILFKLDKPSEAIEAWKKAIASGSENQEIIFEIEQYEKNQ